MRAIPIVLAVTSIAAPAYLSAVAPAAAQYSQPAVGAARAANAKVAGTYKLVATERRDAKGQLVPDPAGTAKRYGLLMYDPGGYMAIGIMPEGRAKFAGAQPTAEEAQAAMTGYQSYIGTFEVDEAKHIITHKTIASINTANLNADLPRAYTLNGNRLTLKPPPGADGVQSTLVFEKLPDLKNLTPTHRQFIGFYKLIMRDRRNAKGEVVSESPGEIGYILYTASGHMQAQIMPPGRKKAAGAQPTADEYLAGYRGFTSYFGPYTINESERTVIHHQEGAANPASVGNAAPRVYEFSGKRLVLKPPVSKGANAEPLQSVITWERLSEGGGPTQ
jgi:hypothetical protein